MAAVISVDVDPQKMYCDVRVVFVLPETQSAVRAGRGRGKEGFVDRSRTLEATVER